VRSLAALAAASVVTATIMNCSTEGEVLLRPTRSDAAFDTVVDTFIPPRDTSAPDTRTIYCGPNSDACAAAGEQCCAQVLSLYCVEAGTCEGGAIPCDQPGHCAAGERCCGAPGGFLLSTWCTTETCAAYTMCARDEDCVPPLTCQPEFAGYRTCK
jgi:hypothetical protein